ncbi:SRPBCC domain-containing protein [Streptomyces sp. V4-01]|uniref:SRPBCC domain-containing protein n=1 Tax=Actinacidiphila polyblastidii TaxID=3110430 RepID=A0ABU7PAC6_9ACTN|nr:SRPBCC domain-containing protein [Streptomyces sp. V4-01]
MPEEFEIVREFEVDAAPDQVWEALTSGSAGWLWPQEYEPREGGAAPFGGAITAWEPGRRLTARTVDPEGVPQQSLNQLDHVIEPRPGGGSYVRYVHSGIFVDDWENQYDGASKHTDFYLHTLAQYLTHFAGRPAVWASVSSAAATAGAPDALESAVAALGLPAGVGVGETVPVLLPGAGEVDAVLDYRTAYFLGLRTPDAMYRVFGRNHWGATVGVAVHDFDARADADTLAQEWQKWLDGVYA